MAILSGKDLKY